MRILSTFLATCLIGISVSAASPTGPCVRSATFYRAKQDAIPDSFSVQLLPKHTIQEHFAYIGLDLSEMPGSAFWASFAPGSYHVTVNETIVNDFILCDPGVEYVHQGSSAGSAPAVGSGEPYEMEERGLPEKPASIYRRFWGFGGSSGPIRTFGEERVGAVWSVRMIESQEKVVDDMETGFRYPYPYKQISRIAKAGEGVDVYILDSGIRISHKAFEGRASNFRNMQTTHYTKGEPPRPMVPRFHGTHVAGIIGMQYLGVAPFANLINVKVTDGDNGDFDSSRIATAIRDITDQHNSNKESPPSENWRGSVINISFHVGEDNGFRDALRAAFDAGIPIAVSAGNDLDLGTTSVPCKYSELGFVVCAGAIDSQYNMVEECCNAVCTDRNSLQCLWGSNFGPGVTILAPGKNIESTSFRSDTSLEKLSGTSMASPHVAGVLAMIVSHENLANDSQRVVNILLQNAVKDVTNATLNWDKWAIGDPWRAFYEEKFKDYPTTKKFLNTGIHNPKKDYDDPYFIPDEMDTADITAAQNPATITVVGPTATETIIPTFTYTEDPAIASYTYYDNFMEKLMEESPVTSVPSSTVLACPEVPYSNCISGVFPTAKPYSGGKKYNCYPRAEGGEGSQPRVNIAQAKSAATDYCKHLIQNNTILSLDNERGTLPYVRHGVGENGSDMVLSVLFDITKCDAPTSALDFKVVGQEKCELNMFYQLSIVCSQDASWKNFNKDFTTSGGIYGEDCGIWSLSAGTSSDYHFPHGYFGVSSAGRPAQDGDWEAYEESRGGYS